VKSELSIVIIQITVTLVTILLAANAN